MNTTAARKSLTTIGQAVEVETVDFATPGMPKVWVAGVVEAVAFTGKLATVTTRRVDGLPQLEIVGPRGGNKRIRLAS